MRAIDDHEIRLHVLLALNAAVERETRALSRARKRKSLATVAWIARNLLELLIWTDYCLQSDQNAATFAEDSARDALDTPKLPPEFSASGEFSFHDARSKLVESAKGTGFDGVDDAFVRVNNAAAAVGKGEMFRGMNKVLSKFAHPTAMMVMTPMTEFEKGLKRIFFEGGMACSRNALSLIGRFQAYPPASR